MCACRFCHRLQITCWLYHFVRCIAYTRVCINVYDHIVTDRYCVAVVGVIFFSDNWNFLNRPTIGFVTVSVCVCTHASLHVNLFFILTLAS